MGDYNVHDDMAAIMHRFAALRTKTREEILGVAYAQDDARFANQPVHRVDVISVRMAVLEQHLIEGHPHFYRVVENHITKGQKFTQRSDYPLAELQAAARDLKDGVTTDKVYSFVSLFTLNELAAIGI